jgi:hypothetical protein
VRFAVIGDYGVCGVYAPDCEPEAAVARQLKFDNPDFIVTVGDNNYEDGEAGYYNHPPPSGPDPGHLANNVRRVFETDDWPLGQQNDGFPPEPPEADGVGVELYQHFLDSKRVQAAMGNHDWHQRGANPTKQWFEVRGSSDKLRVGPVEIFQVDSNQVSQGGKDADPDVVDPPSLDGQKQALVNKLNASGACWKIVYMHHPAYSQSEAHRRADPRVSQFIHDVNVATGGKIDAVLSGHNHLFDHITTSDGVQHLTMGKSGGKLYREADLSQGQGVPQVVFRKTSANDGRYGYLMVTARSPSSAQPQSTIKFEFRQVLEISPPAGPEWWQRWGSTFPYVAGPYSKDCGTLVPTCQVTGECAVDHSNPTTVTNCIQYPYPNSCGTNRVQVDTPLRASCQQENQLIDAWVRVALCCDANPCQDGACPVKARAYNCTNQVIFEMCLVNTGLTVYDGSTGCIFDRWTVPCRWEFVVNNTEYRIKCPARVDYRCCLGCTRTYGVQP